MARVAGLLHIKTLFNIGKKFVDIMDDLWSTLRGVLPAETIRVYSPFIMGSVGFITHLGEGVQGAKEAYRAYKNEKIGQRKTRILSSVLIFMLSGAGLGLATSLIAEALGATISGTAMVFAPVLIPGFLTAIYSLALWRKAYIFYRAKEEEAKAKLEYEQAFSGRSLENPLTDTDKEEKKIRFEALREERLLAERDMAFNIIEVATSILVVTSTVLGTAAIVGASVASLGALPLVLLLTGVIGGVGCKLLEYYDEKNEFKFSRQLRGWITGKWDKLTQPKALTAQNSPTPEPGSRQLKSQGLRTKQGSFLYKRMAEENMIELTSLKKRENSKVLDSLAGPEPTALVSDKDKSGDSTNEFEQLFPIVRQLKA